MLAAQLKKVHVVVKVRVGENGKMFGSVTSKDVAEALIEQTKLDIDRRKVELKGAVKALANTPPLPNCTRKFCRVCRNRSGRIRRLP